MFSQNRSSSHKNQGLKIACEFISVYIPGLKFSFSKFLAAVALKGVVFFGYSAAISYLCAVESISYCPGPSPLDAEFRTKSCF